ncbi:hypothetical protein ROSMUCSMR3_01388 [Roseovarius mucosus]|uniref:Uncharacterized protein n=1 Tax=Roseovarius mucosus TaxID=215743 RepID=A0A1V0RMB3_9RHOB|nr:hypothetical protein [Roseovarius mucosus]ARE82881.1 hypothetical protein ROSMUCSMR3_01388 [Roseovarius mucosus]
MANAVSNMLPDGQKDLTRRAVLRGLSYSTAAVTGPMPAFAAALADDTPVLPGAEHLNHPILSLPFVRDVTTEERASGAAPRCFWQVAPTGDYGADCATGARYAAAALDYMVAENTAQILQWAVFDMMAMCRPRSGIEVGFLSTFGRIATRAHAAHLREGGLA